MFKHIFLAGSSYNKYFVEISLPSGILLILIWFTETAIIWASCFFSPWLSLPNVDFPKNIATGAPWPWLLASLLKVMLTNHRKNKTIRTKTISPKKSDKKSEELFCHLRMMEELNFMYLNAQFWLAN